MKPFKPIFIGLLIFTFSALQAVSADPADTTVSPVTSGSSTSSGDSEFEEFEDEFEEFEDDKIDDVLDPLSGYNRFMTGVNDKLYFWALKPVARGYRAVVPEPGRLAVGRFFKNLGYPIRFVNNLLQFKIKESGIETARFGINTTIGIAGLFDPAEKMFDLKPCGEDFGQTLGHYGIGSGFHIVLPVFGPSNLRDTIGRVPDFFLYPVNYIDDGGTVFAINAFDRTNYTSLHIGEYESVKKDAIDFYIFMRDAYEQNRENRVKE